MPFENLSPDPHDAYLATGLNVDLISHLSRIAGLSVIAWDSSVGPTRSTSAIAEIARALGVRWVLEGSVRLQRDRVGVTVRLKDGASASLVWSDRFEGRLADMFHLQNRLASELVGALQ